MKKKTVFKGLGIFLSLYMFFIILANPIQTIATFPQMGYEKITMGGVEKIYLENSDKEKISAVYLDQNTDKTIFYFHGNGGSINRFAFYIKYLGDLGYNVLCYDYPGYGESEGFPSENNIYEANELFYKYLTEYKKQKPENIIAFGYSVGGAGAIDLAFKKDVSKLIVMSSFTSRYEMSKALIGFPIQKFLFLEDSFKSINKIQKISIPTLIIHGKEDNLIPFSMGESLYQSSISKNKKFIVLSNAGHNNIWQKYEKVLKPFILDFLENSLESPENDIIKLKRELN